MERVGDPVSDCMHAEISASECADLALRVLDLHDLPEAKLLRYVMEAIWLEAFLAGANFAGERIAG